MKYLLPLLLLSLCSCMATQNALDTANLAIADLQHTTLQVQNAVNDPDVTQADLDAMLAVAVGKAVEAKDAAVAVGAAAIEDLKTAKDGFSGLGTLGDGGLITLGTTMLAWYMRDRRKKMGMDPLQRRDVATPPTTTDGVTRVI